MKKRRGDRTSLKTTYGRTSPGLTTGRGDWTKPPREGGVLGPRRVRGYGSGVEEEEAEVEVV